MVASKELFPITPVLPITDVDDGWIGVLLAPRGLICIDNKRGREVSIELDLNRLIALTYYYIAVAAEELRHAAAKKLEASEKMYEMVMKKVKKLAEPKIYDNGAFALADIEAQVNQVRADWVESEELRSEGLKLGNAANALDLALDELQKAINVVGVKVDVPDTYYIFNP